MKFTTKTEYGLICLIHMARNEDTELFSVKEIVEKEKLSPTYVEKIFQKLKAANVVKSYQGKQGGFALARPASEITLREIVEALEGSTFDVYCEPDNRESITCTHFGMCGLRPIWEKTKGLLDEFYASVSLENMAKGELQPSHKVA